MMASELLRNGVERIAEIEVSIRRWMEEREFPVLGEIIGSMSLLRGPSQEAYHRANYRQMLHSWTPDPARLI